MDEMISGKVVPLSVVPLLYKKGDSFILVVEGEYISEGRAMYRSLAGTSYSFQTIPGMAKYFLKEFPDCMCGPPSFFGISKKSRKVDSILRIVKKHNLEYSIKL